MTNDLRAFTAPIIGEGVVSYNKDSRINNIIRLKKNLLDNYGNLGKEKDLFYRSELYPSFDQLLKRIQELKEKGILPILLFLTK